MTRFIIGDLRTGRRIQDLPVLEGTWDDPLNTPETITAKADLNDPGVRALHLRASSAPAKSFLVVQEANRLMGGPIWTSHYDRDARTLELGATGMKSIFDHRLIIPIVAKSLGVDQWTIPDPADETKTMANPLLASSFTGIWLGTIAKRLVQQCMEWVGGDLPIVFQDDEADADSDHERNWEGTDFKTAGSAIDDLTKVDGGPDVNFLAGFTEDLLGVEWRMQTGTVTKPQVSSESITLWNVTAPVTPVSGLMVAKDASKMASLSWEVGGRTADTVLVARAYGSALVDAGFPLMEVLDSSHSSVSQQTTLDGYAVENLHAGQLPAETWSFDVEAYPVNDQGEPAGPQFGSYAKGDYCDLDIQRWDEATGIGDPYYEEGGTKRMRIIGLMGDHKAEKITVKCAPIGSL